MVLCVHVVCCGVCVCTCGVGEAWHAENPPVCTFKTPPCVRSGRLRVYRQQARMSSLLVLSFSSSLLLSCLSSYMSLSLFFFSFFFSLFSFIFSFIFSFTAHTETRSDRQVTPLTKNGHAPRDPLNQERAINLSILAMSHPGKFSRVESN